MIREEQYDEDQDENSDNEYKQKLYYNESGKITDENYSLESL